MSGARWTTLARADLAGIDDFYAACDSDFADRVGREAIRAADWLVAMPHAGAEIASDHRRWRVRTTPYLLIYRVVEDGIEVLRLRHERQNARE